MKKRLYSSQRAMPAHWPLRWPRYETTPHCAKEWVVLLGNNRSVLLTVLALRKSQRWWRLVGERRTCRCSGARENSSAWWHERPLVALLVLFVVVLPFVTQRIYASDEIKY